MGGAYIREGAYIKGNTVYIKQSCSHSCCHHEIPLGYFANSLQIIGIKIQSLHYDNGNTLLGNKYLDVRCQVPSHISKKGVAN